jgi:branched-chain amino acid transport system substrate-binding protein
LADARRKEGTTDSEKLREALLTLKTKNILGDFAVDQRGFQTAQKAVTIQWQDGKQAVVWPDGLGSAPRFPTPNWASR